MSEKNTEIVTEVLHSEHQTSISVNQFTGHATAKHNLNDNGLKLDDEAKKEPHQSQIKANPQEAQYREKNLLELATKFIQAKEKELAAQTVLKQSTSENVSAQSNTLLQQDEAVKLSRLAIEDEALQSKAGQDAQALLMAKPSTPDTAKAVPPTLHDNLSSLSVDVDPSHSLDMPGMKGNEKTVSLAPVDTLQKALQTTAPSPQLDLHSAPSVIDHDASASRVESAKTLSPQSNSTLHSNAFKPLKVTSLKASTEALPARPALSPTEQLKTLEKKLFSKSHVSLSKETAHQVKEAQEFNTSMNKRLDRIENLNRRPLS